MSDRAISSHMQSVDVSELREAVPVGSGACGRVFRASDPQGRVVAVKVFHPSAANPALVEEAAARLETGGWPSAAAETWGWELRGAEWIRVTPFLADEGPDGPVPRSLQHRLARFPGEDSWPVVREILAALAALHDRQVAHGNLKPGNVFFDGGGKVVLVDWALGNMPGAVLPGYTDAYLYQPPDQLLEPAGYLRERGYRWDVFAFGTLAFRLVTGAFPRCAEMFEAAAPEPGATRREGIAANLKSIARMVAASPEVTWPYAPANPLEASFRGILERCLSLDPSARPANASEVLRLFEQAEDAVNEQQAVAAEEENRATASRNAGRVRATGVLAAVAALAFALYWGVRAKESEAALKVREPESVGTNAATEALLEKELEAFQLERAALVQDKAAWLARLEASRAAGDRLFGWVMEEGNAKLPPLDGRERRLERLEAFFEGFIAESADVAELKEERARARLQLAEISLAKGDAEKAAERLEGALATAGDLPSEADLKLRLATDCLWLALHLQETHGQAAQVAFASAREALDAVPEQEVDADRLLHLRAVLDFNESRLLAASGDDGAALEQLHRATRALARLSEQRPDVAVLRSELARCFLDSAEILEAGGEAGSAREVRSMAAESLLELLKADPANLDLRLELAACYGGIADAAVISGDVETAEAMSKAASSLLDELIARQPDMAGVRPLLAAQHGLMAGILRDRGDASGARRRMDEGIRLVEELSGDPLAEFRHALLLWQKGRIEGVEGNREGEISLETRAADALRKLLAGNSVKLRTEQVRRSLGYVLGDLGHAAQLAGKAEVAQASFGEAVEIWTRLATERPRNEEYAESLEWSRQRLDEL